MVMIQEKILNKINDDESYIAFELDMKDKICIPERLRDKIEFFNDEK